MSLYPGNPRLTADGKYVLDDTAIINSMAEAMEDELAFVYERVKGTALPDTGNDDRRLLFVAIARGVLKYLNAHEEAVRTLSSGAGGAAHTHNVDLYVTMNSHVAHS